MTTLLVASGGGHLKQLTELSGRLRGVDQDFIWVTWESPQSRALLDGQQVVYVRQTAPRDFVTVSRNVDFAVRLWRTAGVSALVTTGAQVVLPFLFVGRSLGKECHFIESAARSEGPSLSGRIATHIPGVRLYRQYHEWSDPRWRYVGSVFDGFEVATAPDRDPGRPRKFVVTLGTLPRWQFRRLVDACLRVIPDGSEVTWQTGATDVAGLQIDARPSMGADELELAISEADVVISHAGVGSALTALSCGKRPILVPREAAKGEHVDDHQRQIAQELGERGLALVRTPDELCAADLDEAGRVSIVAPPELPPIMLDAGA